MPVVKQLLVLGAQAEPFHNDDTPMRIAGLREEIEARMAQRKVEPNSALGGAMNYMLERWESLTRFLRVGGVPLDNNASERLLKTSILHRRTVLTVQGLDPSPFPIFGEIFGFSCADGFTIFKRC